MKQPFDILWERLLAHFALRPARKSSAQDEAPPVAINLGIDFGTSFTKVCFRDVGAKTSGIVRFGSETIIPSVTYVGEDGWLGMAHHGVQGTGPQAERFLKMRLAGLGVDGAGVDRVQPGDITCRALSAWFLANVVVEAVAFLIRNESARLAGRRVQWSANLGVPVEHCDSPALHAFEEVLRVAWSWALRGRIPDRLPQLKKLYQEDAADIAGRVTDFHVVPEIAAAVQSFVMSREAVPDFYIYFDIGGGTVDGVAFKYDNDDGEPMVSFYSGKVAPLGMEILSDQRARGQRANELQQLVGGVITEAKRKDGRNWQREAFQRYYTSAPRLGRLGLSDMAPLVVFLGGYGANDDWYKQTIAATYADFRHADAGIPPYELRQAPLPADLNMMGRDASEFVRFAIAYGLSFPLGEGPDLKLPGQITNSLGPCPRGGGPPDYLDHKDIYG